MGILAGDYLINNWRPDLVERVMGYLSPDNVRVTVLTKRAKFFARYVKGGLISEDILTLVPILSKLCKITVPQSKLRPFGLFSLFRWTEILSF